MANKRQLDYQLALGDLINDQIQLRLVVEGIQNCEQQQAQPKNNKQSSSNKFSQFTGSNRPNIQEYLGREEVNFQQDLQIEGGKKYKKYKHYQPPKYQLLGHNQEGKPLFKISDLFLTSDQKLKAVFDRYFEQIIHPNTKNVQLETGELSKKYDKGYDFSKIIENWQKKQYEDFTNNKKNKMDEIELEEIVINRGDCKDNYWIYKVGQKKKYEYQDIFQQKYLQSETPHKNEYLNYNLLNPNFVNNMHKAADRLRLQYNKIQQFESDEDKISTIDNNESNINQQSQMKMKQTSQTQIQQQQSYWGEFRLNQTSQEQKNTQPTNSIKTILLEQQLKQIIAPDPKKPNATNITNQDSKSSCPPTFVQNLIQEYNAANHQIVGNCYKGNESAKQYNRIQFHLQNREFFLTKLHYAFQKKSQQFSNFVQGEGINKSLPQLNKNISAPSVFGMDRSIVSGSRGNQQTIRASHMDGMEAINEDDDHQNIQNKILRQMSSQPKKPINHSQIATKFCFIKFSNQTDHFRNYHRFQFRFDQHLARKVSVSLLRNLKPLKCKGNDLNINVQKKDSYTKFSKVDSLSLASSDIKQFILIQYIEQNPLLLSDVGMCERMIIQTNNNQILQKIEKELIIGKDWQDFEEMRDNNKKNQPITSTQQKMELWRKNIKEHFGENGKVYLWQPKRQSKLIGNPQGLGITLMQSNLANVPVVKKTPDKRDFLLVRDKDRWVLRKIDTMYVSGQVEPKQVVFSPGDRPYQTFLQKYQVDYLTKSAQGSTNNRISIQQVKNGFPNTPQTSTEPRIRKILKQKMKAQTKDNKIYQIIFDENEDIKYKLDPEQFCLFQRMQKSLCQLEQVGIRSMKNMEKMKSILRKYFKKEKTKELKYYAVARMIRDQLQLTSWYLTESFRKFIDGNARIQMVGHADPTNGHGGYSFIKKPQKQRTDKDEVIQKQERNKLSGTQYDLRKLIKLESVSVLEQLGYSREQLTKLGRWELVSLLKSQKDTEYSRKQRESKQLKEQNERKQRSKALNTLIKHLKNEEEGLIQAYDYGFNQFLELDYYEDRQRKNWQIALEKWNKNMSQGDREDGDENEDDGEDED